MVRCGQEVDKHRILHDICLSKMKGNEIGKLPKLVEEVNLLFANHGSLFGWLFKALKLLSTENIRARFFQIHKKEWSFFSEFD